jgi:squalene-hopene/tetraprenyl-beta-curcumene cyclase
MHIRSASSFYLAAILAMGLAGSASAGASPLKRSAAPAPAAVAPADAWQTEARAAVARGLAWLTATQQVNGAWSDPQFPALTALALWSYCDAGQPRHPAADKAVAFILTCVQTNGGIYVDVPGRKGGGLGNYNTGISMTALHATGRKDLTRVIQNARTFVAGSQHFGDDVYSGGFGYDRVTKRAYTDLMNTHFSIEAMRRTQNVEDLRPAGEARADIDWDKALAYVDKLQRKPGGEPGDEGGFVYNPDDPKAGLATNAATGAVVLRAYGSITYAGLLSMVYANVARDDPRIVSAVDFAARHWTLDENPGMGAQGLYFYYNVMSRALDTARLDNIARTGGEPIAWRAQVARKIMSLQRPDGSWANDNNRFWENDPVLATAYSLLALEYAADMAR